MTRTITVKGLGNVSAKPDQIVITMILESMDKSYDQAMQISVTKISQLTAALTKVGFEKSDLKTTNFNVKTEYDSVRKNGRYEQVFLGYKCVQNLKLQFDLDVQRLALVLGEISGCMAEPNMQIRFTVKNPAAISDELLRSATINAKTKAEILCEASGKELGDLLSISYNWGEIDVYSNTRFSMDEAVVCCAGGTADFEEMNIEPDDIEVSDTVTFIWEIK